MNADSPLANIRVVLSHTTHPGNIGASARAMRTMGLRDLYLINPQRFPSAEATAMAAGADETLNQAKVCSALDEALAGTTFIVGLTARKRDLSHDMVPLRVAAAQIIAEAANGKAAVLFGTEMSGLSNAELDRCQLLANIAADERFSSLNLAAAVQVTAYELRQASFAAIPLQKRPFPLADFEQVEGFYGHLEQVMYETEFLDPAQPKRLMRRLRRLFARARLEKEEVNILRGILHAVRKTPIE
jgi:tRNA/rRNA methyltransferase